MSADPKYPSDGEIIDENGKPTGTMGWIAKELLDDEDFVPGDGIKLPKQKPPADWGPERRRLRAGR